MTEEVKGAGFWLKHLVLPVVVIVVAAVILASIITQAPSKEIIFVNPPANLYNAAYNPFLGTWRNDDAKLYGYPKLIVGKDDKDLVYAELFDRCTEPNCSIGKIPAEIHDNILSAHYISQNRTLSMVMSFPADTQLVVDIDYNYITSQGKSSGHMTLGFSEANGSAVD